MTNPKSMTGIKSTTNPISMTAVIDLGFVVDLIPVMDLGFDHEFDASHRYRICPGLDKS
jgi:hypothetical protein